MNFKKGEWCFHDFVLKQVERTDGDKIIEVSDGSFCSSGYALNDWCYPLEMNVKRISNAVEYWSKTFHNLNNSSLNYPDLNRELIRRWCEMCDNRNDEDRLKELYNSLSEFGRSVNEAVSRLSMERVNGISLFRK